RFVGVDPSFAPVGTRSGNRVRGIFDGRPDLRSAAPLGVQKPCKPRHVGCRHRGTGQAAIAAARVGGVDVHSRRGHIHPAAVVGEGGFVVVAVGGGNGDGIVVVGRVGGKGCAAVAGSSHHDGSAVPGVVDRIPQGRGSDGSAQAEADHVGAVVGGVDDPVGHI